MFGAMESSSVAMVKARRESVPANTQRPKSPLGKNTVTANGNRGRNLLNSIPAHFF